jgi:hypothetical protein
MPLTSVWEGMSLPTPDLASDPHVVADGQMSGYADLPGHDNVVADPCAPGNAYLGDDDALLADRDVVADLDQIVDLGPTSQPALAERRPVDGRVGPHFDILLDHNPADLWKLLISTGGRCESKPITADDSPRMDDGPVPDLGAGHEDAVGIEKHILPHLALLADIDTAEHSGPSADARPGPDVGEGVNRRILMHSGLGMDRGQRALSLEGPLRPGKELHSPDEIQIGGGADQRGRDQPGVTLVGDHRSGAGGSEQTGILGVGKKAQFVRTRRLE